MDLLVPKIWQLHKLTAQFRVETILRATAWLEEKYQQAPDDSVATAIALHYLLLAMRDDAPMKAATANGHALGAARWREKAYQWIQATATRVPRGFAVRAGN